MACKCERQNFLDAYNDEMDQTLKEMNIDSPTTEARLQVAQTLRPRFTIDKQSAEREENNMPEYDVPEAGFTLTPDGGVLYTKYNRTLSELHERQQKIQPDQYSKEEHDTSRLIERMFQQGATEVVTSYPRAEGDSRDIVVMRFDPITKIGTTHIINTQVNGKNHDFQEIHGIARDKFTHLADTTSENHLFVLSNAPVKNEKTAEVLRPSQTSEYLYDKKAAPSLDAVVLGEFADTSHQVREKVTQDVSDTIRGIQRYVQTTRKHHPTKENVPPFYVRLFGLKKSPGSERAGKFVSPRPVSTLQSVDTPKKIIRRRLHQVNQGIDRMKGDKRIDRKKTTTVFTATVETEPMKRKKGMKVEKKQPLFRKEKPVREKKRKLKVKEVSARPVHESPVILTRSNSEKKQDKPSENQTDILQKCARIIQRLVRMEQRIVQKERALNRHMYNDEHISKNDQEKPTEQRILIRVTELILLWFITADIEKQPVRKQTAQIQKTVSKDTYHERQDSQTPWILLSIIWYLVMVREQGKVTIVKKQKKKKTNNVNKPTVIFAYDHASNIQTQSIFVI